MLYGPLLSEAAARGFEQCLDELESHHTPLGSSGIGRITRDNPRSGFLGEPEDGLYYHPVLAVGGRPDDRLVREETFGPIVPVVRVRGLDEAVELAAVSGYGLSASVYTNDPSTAFAFRRRVRAGMVSINNSTSGAEAHLPFGGNGRSGNGSRQSGVWVLDQFTRWQAVNWDYTGKLQRAQMDVAEASGNASFRLTEADR